MLQEWLDREHPVIENDQDSKKIDQEETMASFTAAFISL